MLDLFLGFKRIIKRRTINIDSAVFRFHWLITSALLIACSAVVTTRQYVGTPIDCIQTDEIPTSVLNTYCWIHSTFTIPSAFTKKVGVEVPHPGIENTRGTDGRKYYAYYQWVCFALFIQGILFYVPYYLWKLWEGGLMRAISMGMQIALITDQEKGHKRKILIDYLYSHLKHHKFYAIKYFLCEVICLGNLIGQMWFMNWFFDNQFLLFGWDIIKYSHKDQEDRVDPMIFVFPRMTKCLFHTIGSSGDIQKHDALCMLTLNVVNEKIYIGIWFWFVILLVLTIMLLCYRLLTFMVTSLRPILLHRRCRLSEYKDLKTICKSGNIGDWFVLYMLANNLDPLIMREITQEISKRLERKTVQTNGNIHERTHIV